MKKALKGFAAIFLLSGFLVACADGDNPDVPVNPDVPNEQMPGDDTGEDSGM